MSVKSLSKLQPRMLCKSQYAPAMTVGMSIVSGLLAVRRAVIADPAEMFR